MRAIAKFWSKTTVILGLILLLAFLLRFHRYSQFPVAGETADEIAWTWLGASLWQIHEPVSWSYFAVYDQYRLPGDQRLVKPTLDHPPLFAMLPGLFHSLKYSWSSFPSIKLIRLPLVILGTVNVGLFYLMATRIFKKSFYVWLATLIYATVPTIVFASRLAVAENLLISWLLVATYLITSKKLSKHQYWLLILLNFLAVLTKVSGSIIPLAVIIYGWLNQRSQIWRAGLIGLISGWLAFIAYGGVYNWQLFWQVQFSQSGRDLGLATLFNRFFLHPTVVEKILFDGWLLLGLLSLMIVSFIKNSKFQFLKIVFVLQLIFIATAVGETTFHGWYDYILYPYFIIAFTWIFQQLVIEKNYWFLVIFWLFLLANFRLALVHSNYYQSISQSQIRILVFLGLLPLLLSYIQSLKLKQNQWWQFRRLKPDLVAKLLLLLVIVVNIVGIWTFNQVSYWETDEFFLPSRIVK